MRRLISMLVSVLKLSLFSWKILPIGTTLEYLSNSRQGFIVPQDAALKFMVFKIMTWNKNIRFLIYDHPIGD